MVSPARISFAPFCFTIAFCSLVTALWISAGTLPFATMAFRVTVTALLVVTGAVNVTVTATALGVAILTRTRPVRGSPSLTRGGLPAAWMLPGRQSHFNGVPIAVRGRGRMFLLVLLASPMIQVHGLFVLFSSLFREVGLVLLTHFPMLSFPVTRARAIRFSVLTGGLPVPVLLARLLSLATV